MEKCEIKQSWYRQFLDQKKLDLRIIYGSDDFGSYYFRIGVSRIGVFQNLTISGSGYLGSDYFRIGISRIGLFLDLDISDRTNSG